MDNLNALLKSILNLDDDCSDEEIAEAVRKTVDENEMLNLAIDNSIDSFNIADENGVFLRVNETFANNTNLTRQTMEGVKSEDIANAGAYGPSAIVLAIKSKQRVSVLQDGVGGQAIAVSTPIFDDAGEVKYVVSNARFVNEILEIKEFIDYRKEDSVGFKSANKKLICKSESMKYIVELADTVARTDSSVLITGETGTGKSVLARYIHENSNRSDGDFVEINCAAIPGPLIESELFGYEGGAFTGANKQGKKGLMELANGGTLFLDEIGDMPLTLQAKLLQALQNRSVTRIGGEEPIELDIRLITATNMDLEKMIIDGDFRSELYYRINVVPIQIPALRERTGDIPEIIKTSIKNSNVKYNKNTMISKEAEKALLKYSWPGNIRELENIIERLIVTNKKGIIMEEDLPVNITGEEKSDAADIRVDDIIPLKEAIESVEQQLITIAYKKHKSSYKVAKLLGISQSAASRKIIKYIKKTR